MERAETERERKPVPEAGAQLDEYPRRRLRTRLYGRRVGGERDDLADDADVLRVDNLEGIVAVGNPVGDLSPEWEKRE